VTAPAKMLLIYLDETDLWHAQPLYEAIVRRLRQVGLAGATVTHGIMGFGSHKKVHHKRLFGISSASPMTSRCLFRWWTRRRSSVRFCRRFAGWYRKG
jgi:PII-like signaling protein